MIKDDDNRDTTDNIDTMKQETTNDYAAERCSFLFL